MRTQRAARRLGRQVSPPLFVSTSASFHHLCSPFTWAPMDDCDSSADNGGLAGMPNETLHAILVAGLGPRWFFIVRVSALA